MENKNLVIIFSIVLVASFLGALLGAYLVEKTQAPAFPGGQPMPYGIPPQGGQMMPNGTQPPQNGQPNPQGGPMPNGGAPQGTQPPQPLR